MNKIYYIINYKPFLKIKNESVQSIIKYSRETRACVYVYVYVYVCECVTYFFSKNIVSQRMLKIYIINKYKKKNPLAANILKTNKNLITKYTINILPFYHAT